MKSTLVSFIFVFMLINCNISSGQENIFRKIDNFKGIELIGNIRVELYKSDTAGMDISIKDLPLENLITEIKDGILKIHLKSGSNKNATVKIKLYYSEIDNLTVGSRSLITSSEILTGKSMNFKARTGGKMELELSMDNLEAYVEQGAILVFKGIVNNQKVNANSGGTYSAYLLEADSSYVKASTGGKAKVKAEKFIEAISNSGGFIGYIGDPASDFAKTSLGGEVRRYKTNEDAGIE